MTRIERVRVFTDEAGRHGNPLAIVVNGARHDDASALRIAAAAGASETVFIDDADTGRVRIYVPRARVPLAGHPLVGTAWYLRHAGMDVERLLTDAGPVDVSADGHGATIVSAAGRGVPWVTTRLGDTAAVDAADASGEARHDYVWAWIDEKAGSVRARAFASVSGTREDEATGGAALQLAAELGRALRITQGRGSIIDVVPRGDVLALSGRVVSDGHSTLTV